MDMKWLCRYVSFRCIIALYYCVSARNQHCSREAKLMIENRTLKLQSEDCKVRARVICSNCPLHDASIRPSGGCETKSERLGEFGAHNWKNSRFD